MYIKILVCFLDEWLALRDKVAGSIEFLLTLFLKTLAMFFVAGVVVQFSVPLNYCKNTLNV